MKYRFGTPRFCEWDRLWKRDPKEADVTRDEYERVDNNLEEYCLRVFSSSPRYIKDCYVRGDYTGDRTQVFEINNPRILTLDLLKVLQRWLIESGNSNWRIIVPTYVTKNEVIVVYPDTIRISERYEKSLELALKSIAKRMKDFSRQAS
jgi:hypothetical protein